MSPTRHTEHTHARNPPVRPDSGLTSRAPPLACTRSVFDRYNIVDMADLQSAGLLLEDYARRRKQERAAPLERVK